MSREQFTMLWFETTHSFFDMAGEDMNLKVLRAAVALSEAEAVTL